MKYTKCVACSGYLFSVEPGYKVCESCGGIHVVADSAQTVRLFFNFGWTMQAEVSHPDNLKYFDVTIKTPGKRTERSHGWFDITTRDVVQYG